MSDMRIESAKQVIRSRFPELADEEPTLQEMSPTAAVLTFRKALIAEDGAEIAQVVRVTVDQNGQVLKVVTSR